LLFDGCREGVFRDLKIEVEIETEVEIERFRD
jgi:hypothetical protein